MSGIMKNLRKSFSRSSNPPNGNSAPAQERLAPKRADDSLSPQNSNPYTASTSATRRPNVSGMQGSATPSSQPPPAYTPSPILGASLSTQPATHAQASEVGVEDDAYAFLKSFDTVFLIDDSGSMAGRNWRETAEAIQTITPICTLHDADGIDIYFLNHKESPYHKNVKLAGTVVEIFQNVQPRGSTPTGQSLNRILKPYLAELALRPETTKPINIIVVTDGEPSDDVESVLIGAAKRLDKLEAPPWQVGIQFFQVGSEPSARRHLKQLDDELKSIAGDPNLRDIVDTVPFTGDGGASLSGAGILKIVLGAVNRRLDRNSKDLHRNSKDLHKK